VELLLVVAIGLSDVAAPTPASPPRVVHQREAVLLVVVVLLTATPTAAAAPACRAERHVLVLPVCCQLAVAAEAGLLVELVPAAAASAAAG
jgi:hypothetical protein